MIFGLCEPVDRQPTN